MDPVLFMIYITYFADILNNSNPKITLYAKAVQALQNAFNSTQSALLEHYVALNAGKLNASYVMSHCLIFNENCTF